MAAKSRKKGTARARFRLMSPDFRQRAAEALFKGLVADLTSGP